MIFAPVSAFQIPRTFRLAATSIHHHHCCKRTLHTFTSIASPTYHRSSSDQLQRSKSFHLSPPSLNPRLSTLLHFQSPTIATSTPRPFSPRPTTSTSSTTIMNGQEEQLFFNNLASRRITSLFANNLKGSNTNDNSNNNNSNSSGEKDFSTKNKSRELKRLASTMDVKVSKVKELLQRQSLQLDPNSEKGKYVNWLLSSSSSSSSSASKSKVNNEADENNSKSTSTTKKNANTAKKLSNINDSNGRKRQKIDQSSNNNDDIPNNNNNMAINQQAATSKSKPNSSKKSTAQSAPSTNANTQQRSISSTTTTKNANLHSSTKFQDIDLHSLTKKAIADIMNHEYMTDIQSETYHTAKSGTDVLGRARTGTGKTCTYQEYLSSFS